MPRKPSKIFSVSVEYELGDSDPHLPPVKGSKQKRRKFRPKTKDTLFFPEWGQIKIRQVGLPEKLSEKITEEAGKLGQSRSTYITESVLFRMKEWDGAE